MRVTYEQPGFNQVRYIKKFAWRPFWFGQEPVRVLVWLEYYWERQKTHGDYHWSFAGRFPIEHPRKDATC